MMIHERIFFSFQAEQAKELLSQKLKLGPYLDPKDLQKAPFITFLYENISFALEKGFPWTHICLVVQFAHEYLKRILGKSVLYAKN